MSESRLSTALDRGLFSITDAPTLLAVGIQSLGCLAEGGGAVTAVQPDRPCYEKLEGEGCAVAPTFPEADEPFDTGFVAMPRARDLAHLWVAETARRVRPGGLLVVDGAKTDGIDSLHRALRGRLDDYDSLTKAHGRLFWGRVRADDTFAEWRDTPRSAGGYVTGAGIFSADHIDPGSQALADALPDRLPPRIGDFGAGWGYLSAQVLARHGLESIDLVEADFTAIEAARRNVTDPRARFHWADALSWRPEAPLDAIVMNPPFHTGRKADPELGRAFIRAAAAALAPKGALWMVANRHLPYEPDLDTAFSEWQEFGGTSAFKLIHAKAPRAPRKGRKR